MSGYFAALERELTAAAARQAPPRRRGRRVVLMAVAALLLVGVPAAAVTGVLRGHRDRDDVSRLLHSAPIAEGTQSNGARWQLLASSSSGRFCLGLAMPTGDPQELAPGAGGGCGDHEPGQLTLYSASTGLSRYTKPHPRHSLAYGTAPDGAVRIEVSRGRGRLTTQAFDDGEGIEGRFYVIEIPLRWQRSRRHVRAFDARGRVIARAGG